MTGRPDEQCLPRLPDLGRLTDAQKDELIVSLWQTLAATETVGGAEVPVRADGADANRRGRPSAVSAGDLRDRIRRTMPSRRGQGPATKRTGLGRGLGWGDSKILLWVLVAIGFGFLADFGVGRYQLHAIAVHERAALELENAAFAGLTVELLQIRDEPDGKSYRATLAMQNLNPDGPLFLMLNPMRVFEQSGLTWQEVPAQAANGAGSSVVRLDDKQQIEVIFQADAKDWTELIPGYMHMRIESDMLISRSSEPKDDIVERNNRFYVYLKPQGADDAAIRRRSNFAGTPPTFIPMPPH